MAQDLGMQGQWQCPLEQVRMKPVYCWDMTQSWGQSRENDHRFSIFKPSICGVHLVICRCVRLGHTELEWMVFPCEVMLGKSVDPPARDWAKPTMFTRMGGTSQKNSKISLFQCDMCDLPSGKLT